MVGTSASVPSSAPGPRQFFTVTNDLHALAASVKSSDGRRLHLRRGKDQSMSQPHFIVFANEKGGTGKSTTAVHTAIALAASGHRVGALDLDSRQRTMTRYLENRDTTMRRLESELPASARTKCSMIRARTASARQSAA